MDNGKFLQIYRNNLNMITPPEILNELSEYAKKSIAEIAKLSGYERPQAFYDVINGKTKRISTEMADNIISAFPTVQRSWLLTGEGEMLKTGPVAPYSINRENRGRPYYDVDFINGFDVVLNDQTINPAYYIDFEEYEKADCWVNATGDSMKPLINHGDIVAIKKIEDWETYLLYGEIYALVTNEYRTIKKVRRSAIGDDHLRLVPLNVEEFDEQNISREIVREVFQVIGCAKKIF